MWVSRKEFQKLRDEVAALKRLHDSHVVDVTANRNFTVYHPTKTEWVVTERGHDYERRASQRISVLEVLKRVLDRLGIELVYVEGQTSRVDFRDTKAKKVTGSKSDG